jgi:hypothetical protein
MPGWLQKIASLPTTLKEGKAPTVPPSGQLPTQPSKSVLPSQNLPNATIIYGIGASLMFVATFFLLLSARWFPAFAVFVLGLCLTGFALHLLKHQD